MKNILSILLISVLFIGCSENRVDVNELTNKGTDLTVNLSGSVWYHYDNLFTGIGYDVYQNGQLKSEISYKDGKYDGLSKIWYENGQLEIESNWTNHKKNGLSKTWYENGQLKSKIKIETNSKGNYIYGLSKSWYENGQLRSEEKITEGELISRKCWDENGKEIECE